MRRFDILTARRVLSQFLHQVSEGNNSASVVRPAVRRPRSPVRVQLSKQGTGDMQHTLEGIQALINKETDWGGFVSHVQQDLKQQDWWDEDLVKSLETPQAIFSGLAEEMEIEKIKNPMFSLALLRMNSLQKVNFLYPENAQEHKPAPIDDTALAQAGHFLRMSDLVYKLSPEEAGVMLRDVLLDNLNDECDPSVPRHAVFFDHLTQTVVVAIRGTASLKDVIIDSCAVPAPVMEGKGHGHEGISEATQKLLETVVPALAKALEKRPGYKIVFTGHSLGAGMAIMAGLWLRHGNWSGSGSIDKSLTADVIEDLHVYAFAPPPVFTPVDCLSESDTKNIYSFLNDIDVVPRCSLRTLEVTVNRMKKIDDVVQKVDDAGFVGRVIMTHDHNKASEEAAAAAECGQDGEPDRECKLIQDVDDAVKLADEEAKEKTRADGKGWLHEQLYIPGRVFHLYPYAGEGTDVDMAFKTGKSTGLAARYRMQEVSAEHVATAPAIEGDSFVDDHQTINYIKAFQRLDN